MTQDDLKPGDKIKILDADDSGGFYGDGDVATLLYKDDDDDWWADFTCNYTYEGDGEWCIGKGPRFIKLENDVP